MIFFTPNESGLDFLAVFGKTISDQVPWVLRVPRRQDVIDTAAYEKKVLDLVSKHLPVSVPNWQVHTSELIAYPLLEGVPIATINLVIQNYEWYLDSSNLPQVFNQSLVEAMVALHRIDHEEARQAGIRVHNSQEVNGCKDE
ncbi:phosphotransferase [Paenibacillus radicibacter]|uniref:phosphotransferase n=1 Tax=Paenibacillus radicibacter TaxID=2972488 RepID=UPI00280AF70B|nr:phosphotransferase [Paenibacillus radicibacter]